MRKYLIVAGLVAVGVTVAAFSSSHREPVEFYAGHTHDGGQTLGAPEHSGGTDAYGCHNRSVPYHCH